jgi:hypothetical protein
MIVEDRLSKQALTAWYKLRQQLETATDPLKEVADFFSKLPKVKIYTDPYDEDTWPTPWELISENEYCPFNKILGVCYTIQLTERFKNIQPKITISFDSVNKTVYYLLFVEDKVYGYDNDWSNVVDLPKLLKTQKIYTMKQLY